MPCRSPHDITIRLIIFPTRFAYSPSIIVQPPDTSSINIRPHTAWLHMLMNAKVIPSANDWMKPYTEKWYGDWCSHYIGEVSMCVLISHSISLQLYALYSFVGSTSCLNVQNGMCILFTCGISFLPFLIFRFCTLCAVESRQQIHCRRRIGSHSNIWSHTGC